MSKTIILAITLFALLEPTLASAAPNPTFCGRLRKVFDICENYQVKHHLPVFPRCIYQWNRLKKAGCA